MRDLSIAGFEQFARVGSAQSQCRRRSDKLLGGGSLGRSFSRSYAGGLSEGDGRRLVPRPDKERRRASLRRLLNSVTVVSQGSISRALGLKMDHESRCKTPDAVVTSNAVASPSSSSENGSSLSYCSTSSPPSTAGLKTRAHHHRRAKSIGDIDIVPQTPV